MGTKNNPSDGGHMRVATTFETELRALINTHSIENASDTPDFILSQYLIACLDAYGAAVTRRDHWYGDRLPRATPTPVMGQDR